MVDEFRIMKGQDPVRVGALLLRTGITLGMPHREIAQLLGVSRRSVSRWSKDGTFMTVEHGVTLAKLVHERDPSLAAELAALAGETLVTLGLEAPPAAPKTPVAPAVAPAKLVDAVVCAAAEAMDVSPRAIRPALLAALRSAREVGLTMESLEALLGA